MCDVSCRFVDRVRLPPFTTNRWSFLSGWWSWSLKKRGSFDEYETEEIELGMGRAGTCRYWDHDISTQLPLIPLLDGTFGSEATRCSCHGDAETTTADGIWRRDGALGEPPTAGVLIRRSYVCPMNSSGGVIAVTTCLLKCLRGICSIKQHW